MDFDVGDHDSNSNLLDKSESDVITLLICKNLY